MVGPLVVLAFGAAIGGFIGIPGSLFHHPDWNILGHDLAPVLGAELEVPEKTEYLAIGISTLVALAGIGFAWLFYGGGYRQPALTFAARFPGLVRLVQDKFRIDEFYDWAIVRPVRRLSQGLYVVVDRWIIDGLLVSGSARVVDTVGRASRSIQVGDGQRYLGLFALGVAVLVWFTTHPKVDTKITVQGMAVDVDARRGTRAPAQPLEYTFDYGDGNPEVNSEAPQGHHVYDKPGTYKVIVRVKDPRWGTTGKVEHNVEVK
jgi:hypothetical protein